MLQPRSTDEELERLVEQTLARLRNDMIRLEICMAACVALNKPVPDYDGDGMPFALPPR
jgi:hypothetical protein